MKGKKLFLVILSTTLACAALAVTILVVASKGQLVAISNLLSLMEILTPTLMLGLALAINFVHKARVA